MTALGFPTAPPGDGPFLDIGMHAADGNVNWDSFLYNGVGGAGPYMYASFSTSVLGTAKQYSSRWWWRDFGAGGIWDIKMIHVTGFDVGIYSFCIDDREIARLDGYSAVDVNNIETIVARNVRIPPGRHKFSIVIRWTSPAATGLPYYAAPQGILFRRTAPLPVRPGTYGLPTGRTQQAAGQVINVIPLFATGNTNWDSLQYTAAMANGYQLYSSGAQNAARWWDLDLVAGPWILDLMVATFSAGGIISVQVDGVTLATIDTYSAGTVYGVRKTARINVPTSGTHRLRFLMATKNGSSSQYYGILSNLQLRQVWPGNPNALPHRIIDFVNAWSHGNTNWSTLNVSALMAYGGDVQSAGAQNAARWWDLDLRRGTWDLSMLHTTANNRGIYSIRLDGTEVATIDGYAGSAAVNTRTTVTGLKVHASGIHRLSLVMASKNAGSSNYYGTVTALQLRRTA